MSIESCCNPFEMLKYRHYLIYVVYYSNHEACSLDVILTITRLHNKESAGKSLLMTMLVPSAKESKVIANTMVDLLRTNIAKKKVFEHRNRFDLYQ